MDWNTRDIADLTVPPPEPRAGWAEAAARMHECGDDELPDPPAPTRFDEEEWEWQ